VDASGHDSRASGSPGLCKSDLSQYKDSHSRGSQAPLITVTLFQPAAEISLPRRVLDSIPITEIGNFLLIAGLVFYGFSFFAQYHSTGKWTKNLTSLLVIVN